MFLVVLEDDGIVVGSVATAATIAVESDDSHGPGDSLHSPAAAAAVIVCVVVALLLLLVEVVG